MVKRFFGVMSVEDIETITLLRDVNGFYISIEAGPKGYSIIWADHSVDYEDVNDTTENNFKKAYNIIDEAVGPLEIVNRRCYK